MTWNASAIISRLTGAMLLLTSAGFFAGMASSGEFIVPGVLFGAGGFWLAIRRDKRFEHGPELEGRVDQLAERLGATQVDLLAAQEEIGRLREERDFMRELSAGARTGPETASGPPQG